MVLVLVGTDFHQMDRLVRWVDDWAARVAGVEVVVQHGRSAPPQHATARAFLAHDDLEALMARASVIVCPGGPATIAEARRHGRRPLVVTRDPDHHEAVDGHQGRFASFMAARNLITVCTRAEELHDWLDRGVADPTLLAVEPDVDATEQAVANVGRLARSLVRRRRGRPGPDPTRVLYVGGLGRSGSTVLAALLGAIDGVASVGETVHLWERGIATDEPCSCGERFRSCPFWTDVGDRAFGGWDRVDLELVRSLRHAIDRTRHVPAVVAGRTARAAALARSYAEHYARLYRAIAEVAGADLVVDSSKHVSLAANLGWADGIDLRVLHLVRDSRGVAHSTNKVVERPERAGEYMHRARPSRIALEWSGQNLLFDLVARRSPVERLTYDELIDQPDRSLAAVQRFAGVDDSPSTRSFLDGRRATLPGTHMVSGNPVRFADGPMELRHDLAWRTELSAPDRRLVTAVTLPLLRRYGMGGSP